MLQNSLLIVALLLLPGCMASVEVMGSDGQVSQRIKVPLGMRYQVPTQTLEGDPAALQAGVQLGTEAIRVGGAAFATRVAEVAAEQARAAQK